MYFLYHGSDTARARELAQKTIETAKKKHAGASFVKLTPENFSGDKFSELISTQGLFYSASLVFADHLCDEAEVSAEVLGKLKEIKASPNFFVFLEGKLNKKELEKFEKYAEKVQECVLPEKRLTKKEKLALKGEKIDFFEFADTLGSRDRKQLWVLYQDALAEGVPSEEVHGIFFWQVKAMIAASRSGDAVEAGLNPFVFSKAKSFAKNYDEKKLLGMSSALFEMYHEAHRGKIDFAVALERFILEI